MVRDIDLLDKVLKVEETDVVKYNPVLEKDEIWVKVKATLPLKVEGWIMPSVLEEIEKGNMDDSIKESFKEEARECLKEGLVKVFLEYMNDLKTCGLVHCTIHTKESVLVLHPSVFGDIIQDDELKSLIDKLSEKLKELEKKYEDVK